MINLLPPKEKEELFQEEKMKIVWILGILFLSSLLCLTLFLFSIKVFIDGEATVQKILVTERENEFKNSQMQILQDKITVANKKISELESFYQKQIYYSDLINKISTIIPEGISLNNLSLKISPEGRDLECNLFGFALTRDVLLEFKNNLEKESLFQKITFPASSWLEEENINFSVTFKMNSL